ncbi:MAG: phosphoribosylformylglycinamidine synthase subunit PurQ [Alphaproteobacteria bacterium]|nr:phosphoribosylformylglycinamidine synthase subunit PurQ [Alphaproteobacteria bacterium SS10]
MQSAIVVFPGSNRERDVALALERANGKKPIMLWHRDTELPACDLVVLPGGFSYGDYLRCGSMASQSPIMQAVKAFAAKGGAVLGICNGFQILTESGLLPGVMLQNGSLKFIAKKVRLRIDQPDSPFTNHFQGHQVIQVPVAHNEGAYFADDKTLDELEGEGRVAFRYVDADGAATAAGNPNGAARNIAGILSPNRRVLGMMPHPENATDLLHGGIDGLPMFTSIAESLAA